jgi:predicted O-methyltransferase YrrM
MSASRRMPIFAAALRRAGPSPATNGSQPLSLEELARPLVSDDCPGADVDEYVVGQQARLLDIKRQHADAEAELVDRRRQLSEQEGRATDLARQHAEAEADLWKRKQWAACLERLAQFNLRPIVSALVFFRSVLKSLRQYLQTEGSVRRQQATGAIDLLKVENELRNARHAVSDKEAMLRNLEVERARQASRINAITGLIVEQETVLAELERENAKQCDYVEGLIREQHHFEDQPLVRLARSYRRDDWWPELHSLRKISMLHFETLYLLRSLAVRTKDAIVEVGPYIGGSTIALGRGIQMGGGGPLISVEMGGSYPSHALPTNDIITDLKSNVEAYGLTGVVHIMEGFTTDLAVDSAVNRILGRSTIGLLFLDADGNVERDFELYRSRLRLGSILVYDDYLTEQAPEKQTTIKTWVDQAIASGIVESLGLYRWGTWVGRYWG